MNKERQMRIIDDEIGYVSKYMRSISPRISRYAELAVKLEELVRKMREIKNAR